MKSPKDAIIPVIVSSIVALASFYFGSFASDKEVSEIRFELGTKASREKVIELDNKLDRVLMGLCIIDSKTCKLRGQ